MKNQTGLKIIIQLTSLSLFILLLFLALFPVSPGFPYDLFLRLDPLVALGSILGSWRITGRVLCSLVLILVTLLAGRLFCGYICPLGCTIDLSDAALMDEKNLEKAENSRYRRFRNLKYYLLALLVVSSALGFSFLYAFDPISLITRSFTFFLYPLAVFLANALLDLVRPLAEGLGLVNIALAHFSQPVFGSNFVTFFIFIGILMLVVFSRRFWCRYLCPLGAMLGLFSLVAPIRRKVDKGCDACGQCQAACPMDAIKKNPRRTVLSECIGCRTCAMACPQEVISFGWVKGEKEKYRSEVNLSRRGFVSAVSGGLSLGFLGQASLAGAQRGNKILRPPGALPVRWFNNTCIRCGECMKACITNTLQPCSLEAGLESLWTPRHEMRLAGCEQECNVCGQVCPTQAIRALPLEEKKYARIGTAVIKREKCIAWEQNKLCLICDEACPYNAIVFKVVEGHKRPFIDEGKCNGCGICEQLCPILGEAAILVEPMGQIRLKDGSYIEEAKGLKLEFKAEKDRFDEAGTRSSRESGYSEGEDASSEEKDSFLPPGFLP